MSEFDEFWDIVKDSNLQLTINVHDFLASIQSFTEAASWMTHRFIVSAQSQTRVELTQQVIEKLLYVNAAAQEIISFMSQCACEGCNDLRPEES